MNDLISRQAAIDAIKALWNDAPSAQHVSAMFDCEDAIRVLPSAQPEKRTEERTETHGVCLDAISRQAAIDSIQYAGKIGKQTCIDILKRMPSVQPEIIRCRDCKHYKDNECTNVFWGMCESDYCSEGERKDNESGS